MGELYIMLEWWKIWLKCTELVWYFFFFSRQQTVVCWDSFNQMDKAIREGTRQLNKLLGLPASVLNRFNSVCWFNILVLSPICKSSWRQLQSTLAILNKLGNSFPDVVLCSLPSDTVSHGCLFLLFPFQMLRCVTRSLDCSFYFPFRCYTLSPSHWLPVFEY